MISTKGFAPCRKCGNKQLEANDCGYSSFNVGWVKCKKCRHKVTLDNLSCDEKSITSALKHAWRTDKPSDKERIKELEAEIKKLKEGKE